MRRKHNIAAIICTLALVVGSFGIDIDYVVAAKFPVTTDDEPLSWENLEWDNIKSTDAKTDVQQLRFGKKAQGRLVSGDDGQQYQVTLKSSGQLDINLEGDMGKLSGHLTDQKGKSWNPRKAVGGKYTYQLNKGTYYYQVQAEKGAGISETGMDYAVMATFKSAKAKFENNTTRKKAEKLPFDKVFYGHLASNAPVEYYKFTLDKLSCFSFSLTTQITDYTPETFVVTLYNKQGKPMSGWENPDLVEYYKEYGDEYRYSYGYSYGDWWWWDWEMYDNIGLTEVLPAGVYYVGVSVKKDENGKVPSSARYGQYVAHAGIYKPSVSVRLSNEQTEYTGKQIKPPKVTIKKQRKDAYLERYDDEPPYKIQSMTSSVRDGKLKKIGRYKIVQNVWYNHPETGNNSYSYAIFTVTPVRGKINRLSSKNQGEIQISVKKNAQSTGYQIQIARDKKFKKSVRNLKTTNLRETIKGLSAGKKYYVRVRNYKDVKTYYCDYNIAVPESIYGKWSKTRTIVCK